jgi:hypothetical protein
MMVGYVAGFPVADEIRAERRQAGYSIFDELVIGIPCYF